MVDDIQTFSAAEKEVRLRWIGDKTTIFSPPEDIIDNVTVLINEYSDLIRIKVTRSD